MVKTIEVKLILRLSQVGSLDVYLGNIYCLKITIYLVILYLASLRIIYSTDSNLAARLITNYSLLIINLISYKLNL